MPGTLDPARRLILIKHSVPEIIPAVPANRWSLSGEGRRRCAPLAERLAPYAPEVFVTSVEPKAVQTGEITAHLLNRPCATVEGLHEHDRRGVPFSKQEQFEADVARFFANPTQLMFGRETADQSHRRFARAVEHVLEGRDEAHVAIVTHGTVLTLFVARAAGLEAYPLWKQLGLPAFVVLALPGYVLETVVGEV